MASENDLDILAWTMLGEAGGEGEQGMADVGHVILNRLNNGKYGSSIADVAKSPKQFSTWNAGAGGNNPTGRYPKDSQEFKRARDIAAQVVAGTIPGPPGKPLDYTAENITPYWAESKSKHGTYTRNGHTMYPSVPVPPGEVPNAVGSLTDTVPPAAPVPATPMPSTAAMRGITSPTGGNTDLQTALEQYATRERNRVTPQMPPVQSAQTVATIPSRPSMFGDDPGTPAPGTVVGRIPSTPSQFNGDPGTRSNGPVVARIPSSPSQFNGDPGTPANGPVVASIPSRPTPPMSSAPISYAGQESSPRPMPQMPVDRTRVASLQPSSSIGMPPATRSVPTTRIPAGNNIADAQAEQAVLRSLQAPPRPITPSIPGPNPVTKGQERLVASNGIDYTPSAVRAPTQSGGLSRDALDRIRGYNQNSLGPTAFQQPVAQAPASMPTLPSPSQVSAGTGFRVPSTAPRASAPVPFQRPSFAPQQAPQAAVRRAPVPMPFASRPQPQAPLRITVQRDQKPSQPSLWQSDPIRFGLMSTSQSGDNSVGNQADAAAARSSGDGGRIRRY